MSRRNVSGYFVSWMTTNLITFRVVLPCQVVVVRL